VNVTVRDLGKESSPQVMTRAAARRSVARMMNKLHSGTRFPRLAKRGLQLAIVIIMPGGLVGLALFWWLDRHNTRADG
jgi:hypothetical protein